MSWWDEQAGVNAYAYAVIAVAIAILLGILVGPYV